MKRQCLTVNRDAPPGLREEIWSAPLIDGSLAVLIFNKEFTPRPIKVTWDMIGLPVSHRYIVRDLWKHEDFRLPQKESISVLVQSHGVSFLKFSSV